MAFCSRSLSPTRLSVGARAYPLVRSKFSEMRVGGEEGERGGAEEKKAKGGNDSDSIVSAVKENLSLNVASNASRNVEKRKSIGNVVNSIKDIKTGATILKEVVGGIGETTNLLGGVREGSPFGVLGLRNNREEEKGVENLTITVGGPVRTFNPYKGFMRSSVVKTSSVNNNNGIIFGNSNHYDNYNNLILDDSYDNHDPLLSGSRIGYVGRTSIAKSLGINVDNGNMEESPIHSIVKPFVYTEGEGTVVPAGSAVRGF